MQTLIVDDEPLNLEELKFLLSHHDDIQVTAEATRMSEALQLIKQQTFDLVFLDIRMEDKQAGLKIAKEISKQPEPPFIIFVTAYPQYAIEAYDYRPLHYLLKPIAQDKLDLALERAREQHHRPTGQPSPLDTQALLRALNSSYTPAKKLVVKHQYQDPHQLETIRATAYINSDEILYIHKTKLSNTVDIHLADGQVFSGVRQTLQEFESELNDYKFFRAHTSFLVNLEHAHSLKRRSSNDENHFLLLKGSSDELPVSKLKLAALKTALEA